MEDMHVPGDVKDEVTLLESNRKLFWQRILIHNQWLEKNKAIILRKLYYGNTLDYKKMLDTNEQKSSNPWALSSALNNKHPSHYLRKYSIHTYY